MAFIHTARGEYIALSEVVSASPEREGFRIRLKDGESHLVGEHAWHDAIRFDIRGVIPAPQGYAVVEPLGSEAGQIRTHMEPVLGWAVTANGDTLPVTACGMTTHSVDVLVPDGRVVKLDGWFDNLTDWERKL